MSSHLLLTVDYELFGNGSGGVEGCVVDPTRSILEIAEAHGAAVTLFVEALEFEAMERAGLEGMAGPKRDAERVRRQLQDAVTRGHDVQLHLHPQWAEARYTDGRWDLDLERWRIGDLEAPEVREVVRCGRRFLMEMIEPVRPGYRPEVFRAGAWSIQPSTHVLDALRLEGFRVDSSVAPGLRRAERGTWYDFRRAPPELSYWAVGDDVCRPEPGGSLLEVPIAVGPVSPVSNLKEALSARMGRSGQTPPGCTGTYARPGGRWERLKGSASRLSSVHLAMLDFCRLSSGSLLRISKEWQERRGGSRAQIPLVAIGHSKNFGPRPAARLDAFLRVAVTDLGITFGTFAPWIERTASPGSEDGA